MARLSSEERLAQVEGSLNELDFVEDICTALSCTWLDVRKSVPIPGRC